MYYKVKYICIVIIHCHCMEKCSVNILSNISTEENHMDLEQHAVFFFCCFFFFVLAVALERLSMAKKHTLLCDLGWHWCLSAAFDWFLVCSAEGIVPWCCMWTASGTMTSWWNNDFLIYKELGVPWLLEEPIYRT